MIYNFKYEKKKLQKTFQLEKNGRINLVEITKKSSIAKASEG